MVQDVFNAIDRRDIETFNKVIKHVRSEKELDIVDMKLLLDKGFDFDTKLEYGKKIKRKAFLFDLYHDVKMQFLYYDYNAISHVAMTVLDKKNRLRYLVEAFLKADDKNMKSFIKLLEKNNLYDDFVKLVNKSISIEVKIKNYLYLNGNIFENTDDVLNHILFSNLSTKMKIEYLVLLAKDKRTKDGELDLIIENIKDLYDSYNDKLVKTLDKELIDLAIDRKKITLDKIIGDINESRDKGTILVHK